MQAITSGLQQRGCGVQVLQLVRISLNLVNSIFYESEQGVRRCPLPQPLQACAHAAGAAGKALRAEQERALALQSCAGLSTNTGQRSGFLSPAHSCLDLCSQ